MSHVTTHRTAVRAAIGALAIALLSSCLVGCLPEPAPSASPPLSSSTPDSSTGSPAPSETAAAGESIALPASCEEIYSPEMLAALQQRGPLNDPEVTMTSTQNVDALEILGSGIPTIRCTWGAPSETGLATNVSIVDAEQSATIADALMNAGFACESADGGTVCRIEENVLNLDDDIVPLSETHVLRGNAWVSTATINFEMAGYTEDVITTLWG